MTFHPTADPSAPNFHHPFTPYPIQSTLMRAIYDCIENRQLGVFESPTGTGKSLSLLCASLTWLRDHKRNIYNDVGDDDQLKDEPEWMKEHVRKERRRQMWQKRQDLEDKLQAVREKERKIKRRTDGEPDRKRAKVDSTATDEDAFLLDDYVGDDGRRPEDELGLSAETKAMMQNLGMLGHEKTDQDESINEMKIFVCSRTHSQLSQMVGELRRIKLTSSFPVSLTSEEFPIEEIKQMSLGSRKNLCINKEVARLSSQTAINERCLELQEKKTPADKKCSYVLSKENEGLAIDFRHRALSKVGDIEDLGQLGKEMGICPYYATRSAIGPAEIVMLPYPLILQRTSREALGIDLKDQIVIIDEAHNLTDAISGIHTTEISLAHLQLGREQLMAYLQKFRNRLKGKNRFFVAQVVRLLDSLIGYLLKAQSKSSSHSGTVNSNELLSGKGLDQIDLYQLMKYLQESKLARKVQGYRLHQKDQEEQQRAGRPRSKVPETIIDTTPVLQTFQNFILALTNPQAEGRFFYTTSSSQAETKLRYLLLDPSQHFREVVESARSVILTGGTMSPIDDYSRQLVPYLQADKLTSLSCGHVIPATNLLVSAVTTSTDGHEFDFTFSKRNDSRVIRALGETLLKMIKTIPDGVVIFFPSYGYLETVITSLKHSSLWSEIEALKPIFTDSRTANTDSVLLSYSAAILTSVNGKGAVLMSVVGGKLSEGINFSDRLGRCVIVVGLPYPNPSSAEWKAKMEYIESTRPKGSIKGQASREYADNVCMRAVNQAIGRAVRHKDDWAGILLFDRRYADERIRRKLPGWIQASLARSSSTAEVVAAMERFYRR